MSEGAPGGSRAINRSLAIISPKPPFLKWAQGAYGNAAPPAGLPNQPLAFLIPKAANDQDGYDYVQVECADIFAAMLSGWNPDPASWPGDLDSCSQFTAWFDVQIVLAVADIAVEEDIVDGQAERPSAHEE